VVVAALALAVSILLAGDPSATGSDQPHLGEPAAATAAAPATHSAEDPLEGLNRRIYRLNQTLDKYLLRPVAMTYRRLLAAPIRRGVHNALRNWDEPGVVVNDLLQRRFTDAGRATYRFGINTTVGLVGFFDVATDHGVIHHENGFALTLARYGMANGPYLYLPFAGPSTTRELLGAVVDIGTNPLTNIRHIRSKMLEQAQSVVSVIDTRSTLDEDLQDIAVTATDPYASIRSIYLQRLQSQVRGDVISLEDSPDIPGSPELPVGRKPPAGAQTPPSEPAPPPPPAATTAPQTTAALSDAPTPAERFEITASRRTEAGE
jgi:phospholipid-binding lipoprotein MlaA